MSVHITDPLCYQKIAKVEGVQWVRDEANHMAQVAQFSYVLSSQSFAGAILYWHQYQSGTIYGLGGYNRYFIREDGRVAFSKYHCTYAEKMELAIVLGFDVE